jgi:glycosyltransferase involved in cell wall biosynthesis
MRLLIVTQKVDKNDDVLGFFHDWILELAQKFSLVTVICLQAGDRSLPSNVKVLSLGKEKLGTALGWRRYINRLIYLLRFYYICWTERNNYDAVFVHMNHNYVIYGYYLWRLLSKKIGLWYAHGAVPFNLRIAEKLADIIFTSTPSGFRLKSDKLKIIGQGIDLKKFSVKTKTDGQSQSFTIVTVGRISAAKNIKLMIEVAERLKKRNFSFVMKLAGAPITEADKSYFDLLLAEVSEKSLGDQIKFVGSVPYQAVAEFYQSADLFINLSDTGSLDKAILEAMASGLPVLTSNESASRILPKEFITTKEPQEVSDKIMALVSRQTQDLRPIVVTDHSLESLTDKILLNYNTL